VQKNLSLITATIALEENRLIELKKQKAKSDGVLATGILSKYDKTISRQSIILSVPKIIKVEPKSINVQNHARRNGISMTES
jgi:hypothetical protein